MQQSKVNSSVEISDDYLVVHKSELVRKNAQASPMSNDTKVESKDSTSSYLVGTSRGSLKQLSNVSLPPTLSDWPNAWRSTFRFVAQTTGSPTYAITANKLAGALGCVTFVANTTGRAIFGTVKLNKITVWPSQNASAIANLADCLWNSPITGIGKDSTSIRSLPLGISTTAACVFSPPPKTFAGDWMQLGTLGTQQIFAMILSNGSIVDVDVSVSLFNNTTGATITYSGTTAAVGVAGYTPLDGSGGGLIPQGRGVQL
jgi:hypothetical protein